MALPFLGSSRLRSGGKNEVPFVNGRLKVGYEPKKGFFTRGNSIYRQDKNGLEVWLGDMDNEDDQIVLSETVKKIPTIKDGEKSQADILFAFGDKAP